MTLPPFLLNKNLWLIAGAVAAAWVVAIWHNAKVSAAEEEGYARGMKDERLVWQVRENIELNAKNELITKLQEEYRALEQKSAKDVAAVAEELQKGIKHAQADRDRFVADVRAGRVRLRIPGAAPCSQSPSGDPTPSPGAGPAGSDAPAGSELPPKIAEDLFTLMAEADEVVLQLQAAQELIRKDREVCK